MPLLFRGQHRDEEVLLVSRQHPCILLKRLLLAALVLLVPFAVNVFVPVGLFLAVSIVLSLLLGLFILVATSYAWWNTTFLLTSERIVLLEQRGPFNRQFGEVHLQSITQVSHEIRGILETLCGYGSISISTGSSQGSFLIPNLADPYEIQQEIQAAVAGEEPE